MGTYGLFAGHVCPQQRHAAAPEPARGGRLTDLHRFLNLKSEDDWLLVTAWLSAALHPKGPYPVLHPKGEQGTAKTTFGKMLRRLFDPNRVDLRSQPHEARPGRVQPARLGAVLRQPVGCPAVAVRRGPVPGRDRGRDRDPHLVHRRRGDDLDFTRPVLITSIEDVIGQPDLLDRCAATRTVPHPGPRAQDRRRPVGRARCRPAGDLGRPAGRGGDGAMELLPGVVSGAPVPRMADFAVFGEAVARALGTPPGRFLEVLAGTRSNADQDALQGSPLALTLYEWIKDGGTFTGTYTMLGEI